MASKCEKEFVPENFGVTHKKPILFFTPQFGPNILYPVLTGICILYHLVALSIDAYQAYDKVQTHSANYFLYFPNWSYWLLIVSFIVSFVTTLYVHFAAQYLLNERESNKSDVKITTRNKEVNISYRTMGKLYAMPWYLKCDWVFFTTASVIGITVTIIYWSLYFVHTYTGIVPMLESVKLNEGVFDFGSLAFHIINSVLILMHAFITAKPVRLLHFYMPVTFAFVYIIFTIIYQAIAEEYIYQVLDWSDAFVAVSIAAGLLLILIPLVHLLLYIFVRARTALGEWWQLKYAVRQWQKGKSKNQIHPKGSNK